MAMPAEILHKLVNLEANIKIHDIKFKDKIIDIHHKPFFIEYDKLVIAPGRSGVDFIREILDKLSITYNDNIVDIGIRLEMDSIHYPIVKDYCGHT